MQDFEKLGAFYLGRRHDLDSGTTAPESILYDSKDLTTHAVCVGMTGSGKTGLCLSLLEEAALDNVPVIAIDPKGDLGNLLLTFPKLRPSDFEPWVDAGQATRGGQSKSEYAASVAKLWKNGLAKWGQDGERIQRLRDATDINIYTPGSSAGIPLSIIKSFAAPAQEVLDDSDVFREQVASAASGLLTLLGVDADPITSREHILLSNIFERSWRESKGLELADTIRAIQKPPFDRVGILDLESFFPEKDRIKFSLRINNLLASPSFSGWLEGEPMDAQRLLYSPDGTPRISVLSIAHLNDSERMFFVTMILNEVLGWMRSQPGTSSLRAILYMDEVFGYFPPTANPPSKKPMLTLLKQARAFGLGVVLATQNPVDLDYKGLSNTGTWFLGRLQTERDKMRVLEGLEGASVGANAFDRQKMEQTLAGLGSRVFLMHNVHDDEPVVFETRWAMSYLRGPLTRQQIKELMRTKRNAKKGSEKSAAKPTTNSAASSTPNQPSFDLSNLVPVATVSSTSPTPSAEEGSNGDAEHDPRTLLPAEVTQYYLPLVPTHVESRRLVYRAKVMGFADLHFKRLTYQVDVWQSKMPIMAPAKSTSSWKGSELWGGNASSLELEPRQNALHESPPAPLCKPKNYADWSKRLKQTLYQQCRLTIWQCKELKAVSKPGETEGDFRARLSQLANEQRDLEVEKLRAKFAAKFSTIRDRLVRAQQKVAKEQEQFKSKSMDSFLSIGQTLLGAVLGRKVASKTNMNSAASSMRRVRGAADERGDIARAKEDVAKHQAELKELEVKFKAQTELLNDKLDAKNLILKEIVVAPTKTDIQVHWVAAVWTPWWVSDAGVAEPAWQQEGAEPL